MAGLGDLLETGDKVASIAGATIGLAALWVAVRTGRTRRRRPDPRISALLDAQLNDAGHHRYKFGEHVPALTDLHVRPRAALGGLAEGDKPRTVEATQILTSHRHAVLLGDAGAGKSTFLATVAGELAAHARGRNGRADIAVIVPAADLVGRQLPNALAVAVSRDLDVQVPTDVFDRPPARGSSWRVLVDGLDEILASHDRDKVLWWLKQKLEERGPYRFVLTGRPLTGPELAELRRPDVGVYDLRPFNQRELDEFARNWFSARHPHDRQLAGRAAGRFLARVAGARLGPVARVPLLATIAALVHESETARELPSSRAELYDRFVDQLLDGRAALSRYREAVEPDLLARGTPGADIAAWLFGDIRRHVGGLLRACGSAWLEDPDSRLAVVAATWFDTNAPHDLSPHHRDRILRDLLLATGVCTLRRDRLVFAHQSFAEYFAAAAVSPPFASTFEERMWMAWVSDPVTRSLAAFAAARHPDPDTLLAELLSRGESNAAGDLLADGIPARPATRERIIGMLLQQVTDDTESAPEALRILGELSLDAAVLEKMSLLAADKQLPDWTRALVADRIADVDPVAGLQLLRTVAETATEAVRSWIFDALDERGDPVDVETRYSLAGYADASRPRPLGALARQALIKRLTDARATNAERLEAARQLAVNGDLSPLRAMAEAADVDPYHRVSLAAALADFGEPDLLRNLGTGSAGTPQAAYAAALDLLSRGDPEAGAALSLVAESYPDRPLAYGAAAYCAEIGDLEPLIRLAREPGEAAVRFAAARRLATLGRVDALGWLLDDPLPPALEAATLAELLDTGQEWVIPRLSAFLRRHRLGRYVQTDLYYLLARSGDTPSLRVLTRSAHRRIGSRKAIQAAIALTALNDPVGPEILRRTATSRWLPQRARMTAATGLANSAHADSLNLLRHLVRAGSTTAMRRRAAMVALGHLGATEPLVELAMDVTNPVGQRAEAIDVLLRHNGGGEFAPVLADLATASDTPGLVQVAAARLLPGEQEQEVLNSIARSAPQPAARVAAISRLADNDREGASALFGRLLRDPGIARVRRWWLALDNSELLSPHDARTLDSRLGDIDDGAVRWVGKALALAIRRPEHVFED